MKIAVHAANEHFADRDAMFLSPEELLEPGSLARAARGIGLSCVTCQPVSLPVGHDTVYLTTADAQGMMVSFIQSNFRAFGSGIVIPGTGISMQNRASGFSLILITQIVWRLASGRFIPLFPVSYSKWQTGLELWRDGRAYAAPRSCANGQPYF